MSKYPVQYLSGSKKQALNIEDMATPHLMNAWRKLGGFEKVTCDQTDQLLASMTRELAARGGTYDVETDRWVFPAKEEA